MSVKTSHRRVARRSVRTIPCYLGGQLHSRKNGSCTDCGTTREQAAR